MRKDQVRNVNHAFAYLLDCTLATVEMLAMKKSRSEGEFKRQKGMAQTAFNWAFDFGVDLAGTRGTDVMHAADGSVDEWASQYDVKRKA